VPARESNIRRDSARFTQNTILLGVSVLLSLVLAATILLTLRNNQQLEDILAESVRSELISTSIAARDIIQPYTDVFLSVHSQADVDANERWPEVVGKLRVLCEEVGAEYIYALKYEDGAYWFVFDTDEQAAIEHNIYTPYELSPVHEEAFAGNNAADLLNVSDEWGSYNTGAVPLYHDGEIIGIVSTDIADTYIERSQTTARFYATMLVVVMLLSMSVLLGSLAVLLRRNSRMQAYLLKIANNDAITDLPNRYHLFNYLEEKREQFEREQAPFALIFIDLDNFKTVNDNAGHDAGDDLLREIATLLSRYNTVENNALVQQASQNDSDKKQILRPLTARIGGDEFLQIVPGIANAQAAAHYAEGLLEAFTEQAGLESFIKDFGVGLSLGVALFPSHAIDYDELIRYADIAMYHSKNSGKHRFAIYDPTMDENLVDVELSVRRHKQKIDDVKLDMHHHKEKS
jgi:GGDEF domain-containing protein